MLFLILCVVFIGVHLSYHNEMLLTHLLRIHFLLVVLSCLSSMVADTLCAPYDNNV